MIEQKDVIAFFDERAGEWDAGMVRSDEKIGRILDNAKVTAGSRVLDIACGTGVLIGDYLRRNVESVTAVDISPEMIRIAREKFPQENVRFVCGDAETAPLGEGFDAIVIYNAFPHFPDPERLVARLAALLAPGGRLVLSVSLDRAEWLDMNGRRLPLYPDDPDRTASLLRAVGLVLTDAVPVEAALLLAAGKPQDT